MDDDSLLRIRELGQGIWLRHLRRRLIESGELAALIAGGAVSGIESDLLVLRAAVERGAEYRQTLEQLPAEHRVEALLVEEARLAADSLQAVHRASDGGDGYVCVDIAPHLADEADGMARAIHRLLSAVERPNVMARVPATDSGFALLETMTSEGHHVQIGPLFSVASMTRATRSFLEGARSFLAGGGTPGDVSAAVSFGLAPLEVAVDEMLRERIRDSDRDTSGAESLLGNCARAVAKVACRAQRQLLDGELGPELSALGPRMFRIMWTGLASGDPRARDLRYIESLIGPDTVVSLSLDALRRFRRQGVAATTLGRGVDAAAEILGELANLGIDADAIGRELEIYAAGVLRSAHERLDATLTAAARALESDAQAAAAAAAAGAPWSNLRPEVPDGVAGSVEPRDEQLMRRLWNRDASLWSADTDRHDAIRNRLGWLDVAESGLAEQEPMRRFAAQVRESDVEDIVLLGMGGSSLCAEVCRRVFKVAHFGVLDSTVPAAVRSVAERIDPARTLMLVASKSGTTIEVRALADYFYAQATPMLENPGGQFVAITDPGTPLEQAAHERGFERLWLAPPDIGGRFSALSPFGVLPMALMGIDTSAVLESARGMAASCGAEVAMGANPGARLGMGLNRAHAGGRDKLTFLSTPGLASFGLWAEQLVSESLGKSGIGVVPVAEEPRGDADDYGDDRTFVAMRMAGEEDPGLEGLLERLEADGHPVMHLGLEDRHDLGAEFFRWEIGVAVAGALMGLDPFDQPDVQASKDRTAAILDAHVAGTPMAGQPPLAEDTGWAVFADLERDEELAARQRGSGLESWLAAHLGRAEPPDYVGVQAFVAPDRRIARSLAELRRLLRSELGIATTMGWGPSFLHSTGQMHKGGADRGIFLQITADDPEDLDWPGQGYSFGRLARAQSLGDLAALQERGRRVLRVHLREAVSGVGGLAEAAKRALHRG